MTVLVIAPHPDDEVLGCGGVIAKRVTEGDDVIVCVVSEGTETMYSPDFIKAEKQEMYNADKRLGVKYTISLGYPSAMLDEIPQYQINNSLSDVIKIVKPDEVFIPHRGDIHKDHQIVSDAAMVALRPRGDNDVWRILAYETMSETDWGIPNTQNAFIPNVYEDISYFIEAKIAAMQLYGSQIQKEPAARSIGGIKGLATHRGSVVGTKYAEAFMLIREVG